MSVEFECHHCGRGLRADERSVGRRVRCPQCATLITIPPPPEELEELDEIELDEEAANLEEIEPAPDVKPIAAPPSSGGSLAEPPLAEPPRLASPPKPSAPPPPAPIASAPSKRASRRASHGPIAEAPLLPPPRPHPEDLIDMTAMVDIVFFLLIFFLVTSLQALESVMDMPTPQAAEAGVSTGKSMADLENDPNFITVRIEDDDSIWVDDKQVFNDQELSLELRKARKAADGPRSLLVIGDADASHGAAVRVFDAGAGAGVSGISLVVQEKSEASK